MKLTTFREASWLSFLFGGLGGVVLNQLAAQKVPLRDAIDIAHLKTWSHVAVVKGFLDLHKVKWKWDHGAKVLKLLGTLSGKSIKFNADGTAEFRSRLGKLPVTNSNLVPVLLRFIRAKKQVKT